MDRIVKYVLFTAAAFVMAFLPGRLLSQISTVTTGDTSLCVAASVQLQTTPSGGTAYTYSWSPAAGLSSTSIANPTANPASTTTYTVLITETTSGDTVSDAVTITIQNIPPPLQIIPQFDTICQGDTVALDVINNPNCAGNQGSCITASSIGTVGTGTFGGFSAFDNPFFTVSNFFQNVRSNKRQLIYTQAELNAAGIVGPTNISAISLNVTFSTQSFNYANFKIDMGCTSSSSFSSAYLTGLTNVFSPKTVSVGSNTGWQEFSFDRPFSWDGTSNIVVELCYANASAANNTLGIQFQTTTSNTVRFVTANSNVCASTSGTNGNRRPNMRFRHCDLAHSSGLTYSWTPTTNLSSSSIKNPNAYPATTTSYILTATDARNCTLVDTTVITVAPNFTLSVNPDTALCEADTLVLAGVDNGTNMSYLWTAGASIVNDTLKTTKAYFTSSTSVNLRATSLAGCEKNESFQVDFNPPVSAEILTDDTTICNGDGLPLSLTTSSNQCAAYSWISCPSPNTETLAGSSTFPTGGITISPFDVNAAATTSGARKQYLILASELSNISGMDAISSLGFNIQSITNSTTRQNFTIKMMCTSSSSFGFGAGTFESGATTVFNSKTITLATGWNDLTFDAPFVWDGSSNVIVEICWQNSTSIGFGLTTMDWTIKTFTCQAINWNSSNYCTDSSYNFATTVRPEMRFNYCSSPPNPAFKYAWTPSTGLSNDTVAQPTASPTTSTQYKVTVTDPATGCLDSDSMQLDVAPNFNTTMTADSILCFIDSVQLSATHNATSSVTFNWSPANAVTNPSISNPKTYIDKGKTIVSEITSADGCIKWDTVNLSVTDQILSIIDTIGQAKCAGDSLQFSVIQTLGCGASDNQLCTTLSTAVLGNSVTTTRNFNVTPFVATSASGKKQFLIRRSELNSAGFNSSGQFTSLAFDITTVGLANYENFRIRMGCTNATQASTNYDNDIEVVFEPKDVTLTTGLFWFTFDNRFNWDGLSNIIVEICYQNSQTGINTEIRYNQPSPSYNCLTYSRGNSVCNAGSGTRYNRRPNMQFRYCPFVPTNFTYDWSPNNMFNDPGIRSPKAIINDPGKYFLQVEYTPTGCIAVDSIELDFINITVDARTDTSLCTSLGYQLDVATDAVNPLYFWSPPNQVDQPAIQDPTITVDTGRVFIVEVTDSSGCVKSDTVDIVLLPRPNAVVPPDVLLCANEPHVLVGGGGGTYEWSPPNGLSDPNIATPTVRTSQTTYYKLKVTNTSGCDDEDSVLVEIHPSPTLDLGPDTTYCIGGDLILNAGGGFSTYRWQDGSQDTMYVVTGDGKYWVQVDDRFGCEFSDTVNVLLSPPPITAISYTTDICEGDSAVLDALNPGSTYLWSTGATSQQITIKEDGFYWVVIDDGRCKAKDSTIATVYEYPPWILGDEIKYCEKEKPYGIIVTAGSDDYQYEWSHGKVTPSVLLDTKGYYSVKISNGQKCFIEGGFELKQGCQAYYYVPNSFTPNGDLVNDEFSVSVGNVDEFHFEIYTRWGEMILQTDYKDFTWDGTIDGKDMPSTSYVWKIYIKVREEDGSFTNISETGTFKLIK